MQKMNPIKEFIQKSAAMFGYQILSIRRFPIDMDREFKPVYQKCKDFTMTSVERMYSLYKATQYIINAKVPGDFVECGVWKGGSTMNMARSLIKMKDLSRNIYLYDTFTGMTEPTKFDKRLFDSKSFTKLWKKTKKKDHNEMAYSPIEEVKKNMDSTGYPNDKLKFIKGKVEETIPKIMPNKIALLRLDTDWYESTKHELEHLYPLISKGGIVIIDDYGFCTGSKKATDEYFSNRKDILLHRIDTPSRIGVKIR